MPSGPEHRQSEHKGTRLRLGLTWKLNSALVMCGSGLLYGPTQKWRLTSTSMWSGLKRYQGSEPVHIQ